MWDVLVRRPGVADGKYVRDSRHALRRLARQRMFRMIDMRAVSTANIAVIRVTVRRESAELRL